MIRLNSHKLPTSFLAIFAIGVLIFCGCAQENPLLYDPTMRDSSVSIRFVNMSGDGIPKAFSIDGCNDFSDIPFGTSSDLRVNTIDSAHFSLLSSGQIVYSTKSLQRQKLSFFRNTIQTFLSMKSPNVDSAKILQLSTFRTDIVRGKSIIRVVNTIDDTSAYNVYLGCEQGEIIAESLMSGLISPDKQIIPGLSAITIARASDNSIIGTYDNQRVQFSSDSIYTIIIGKDKQSLQPRLWVLNELSNSQGNQLAEFLPATSLQAGVSLYNLTTLNINASLSQGSQSSVLSQSLRPLASDTTILTACQITGNQRVVISDINGKVIADESIAISPYRSYTCILAPNIFSANGLSLYIIEKRQTNIPNDVSIVKAISTGYEQSISINSAARSSNNSFESGRILFESIPNGFISKEISIFSGSVPILVQTTSTPQVILNQYISQLSSNSRYLMVAMPDKMIMINEDTREISIAEQGAIAQILHAGTSNLKPLISLGNIITKANLQSDGVITSVIPLNRSTLLNTDKQSESITANNKFMRYCFMIDESENLLDYSYNATQIDKKLTKIRIVNLSPNTEADLYLDYDIRLYDIQDTNKARVLEIRNNNRDFYSQIRGITYKQSSDYITIDRERRLSFSLIRWQDPPFIYASLNNVLISLGKNYCILLVPETNGKYRTIIRQEY
ncbi:MAG: hypothetical protein ACO30P_00625 [Candidatus Kapaibacteriota bacterium]